MIEINNEYKQEIENGYYIIKNLNRTLSYNISNTYDKSKEDNIIFIEAYFKGSTRDNAEGFTEGSAILRFLKDGESGTNGSKYSAIVTYNNKGYEEKNNRGIPDKLQLLYVKNKNNIGYT